MVNEQEVIIMCRKRGWPLVHTKKAAKSSKLRPSQFNFRSTVKLEVAP